MLLIHNRFVELLSNTRGGMETDRQTERETERETDRERQTERERQREMSVGAGIAQWLERRTRDRKVAAGEFSSPGSTFCADSYFGICSTPVFPQ